VVTKIPKCYNRRNGRCTERSGTMIAKQTKELISLRCIVTIPFIFEVQMRTKQLKLGIGKLRKNVDSLNYINNNKLEKFYGNLVLKQVFPKQ